MSTKGMSNTSARRLVDEMCGEATSSYWPCMISIKAASPFLRRCARIHEDTRSQTTWKLRMSGSLGSNPRAPSIKVARPAGEGICVRTARRRKRLSFFGALPGTPYHSCSVSLRFVIQQAPPVDQKAKSPPNERGRLECSPWLRSRRLGVHGFLLFHSL
jgi:hypothetical protein